MKAEIALHRGGGAIPFIVRVLVKVVSQRFPAVPRTFTLLDNYYQNYVITFIVVSNW